MMEKIINFPKHPAFTGLFIIIIISGIALNRSEVKYNSAVFTIHKIVTLILVAYSVISFITLIKTGNTNILINFIAIFGSLAILTLFSTGVFMSIKKEFHHILPIIHGVTTFLLIISVLLVLRFRT